jgi:hypothetical protein
MLLSVEEQVFIAKQLDENKGLKKVLDNDALAKDNEKYTLAIRAMSIVKGFNKNQCLADILCYRYLIEADIAFYKLAIEVMLKVDEDHASTMWSIFGTPSFIKEGINKFIKRTDEILNQCCQSVNLSDSSMVTLTIIRKNLLDEQQIINQGNAKLIK